MAVLPGAAVTLERIHPPIGAISQGSSGIGIHTDFKIKINSLNYFSAVTTEISRVKHTNIFFLGPLQELTNILGDFPESFVGKESACNAKDPSSIPRSGRYIGEGIGYPLSIPAFPLWLSW